MRRRQLFADRERQLAGEADAQRLKDKTVSMEDVKMGVKSEENSNIVSKSAQPALKEKAAMFLPDKIVKPNGTLARKKSK